MSISYLLNLVPTKIVFDITPIKKWSGGKLLVLHLKKFRCIEWVNILKGCIKILEVKRHACIIMRYYEESKTYRLFDMIKQHTIIQRDVILDENTSCIKLLHSTSSLMSNCDAGAPSKVSNVMSWSHVVTRGMIQMVKGNTNSNVILIRILGSQPCCQF